MIPGVVAGCFQEILTGWGLATYLFNGSQLSTSNRWGWRFSLSSNRVCNRLRAIQHSLSVGTSTWRVIIHRDSDNAVIAQADVVVSGRDVWCSAAVPEFVLLAGVNYTISARVLAGVTAWRYNNTVTYAPDVTPFSTTAGLGGAGASDNRPSSVDGTLGFRHCDFGLA